MNKRKSIFINQSAVFLLALSLLVNKVGTAQEQSISLKQLLQLAETNYSALKSKKLEVQAEEKSISVSKSTLIPSLDASYQLNYATYNNITGMAYPQFLVPISGPPSTSNTLNGVFGSVISLLLSWQPITFGQREAQVDLSRANLYYAQADADNEIFQHKIKVIHAYLDVITATELVSVFQNNLERTATNLKAIQSLVMSGLRPGVDTAIFKAEVSKAKVELLNSQKYKDQASIYFSQLLATGRILAFSDTTFFSRLPADVTRPDSVEHPLINLYKKNIANQLARKKVILKTINPVLAVWTTAYARGSGISYQGTVNAAEGLGLQRFNYGIGAQLSIPLLQSLKIRPQLAQQDLLVLSNNEKLIEIQWLLQKQQEQYDASLRHALAVINESPLFLESAGFSYRVMQSRYQSGLANISDLMQAQYNLLKSETDIKLAYMGVWKAFLNKAAVNGDLSLFINQVN